MGWFIVPPFHPGRVEAPRGPRLENAGDSCCLRPDGLGLPSHRDAKYQTATPEWSPSVIQAAGIYLKEREHRKEEQWDWPLPPSPLPTDIDLCCNNLLYHLCYGYCQGGWWETPPCFSITVCEISINIAISQLRATFSVLYWQNMDTFYFI